MAASRVVESGGLIVPLAEAGACQGAGSTTCGAVETVEESGRLTGLELVSPVGPPVGGRSVTSWRNHHPVWRWWKLISFRVL